MTELEKAARMALEFCEFCWRDVSMNDYALEKLEQTTDALTQALATTEPKCACGDRPASQCDEEWGPQCDLGNNPKYARPAAVERKGEPVAYFVTWPGDPVGMRRFYGADEWATSRGTVEYFGGNARPLVYGDTSPQVPEDHPLMVFAIECEMGALQEHEVPIRARLAIRAARKGE